MSRTPALSAWGMVVTSTMGAKDHRGEVTTSKRL
jgi:hypothetical protein